MSMFFSGVPNWVVVVSGVVMGIVVGFLILWVCLPDYHHCNTEFYQATLSECVHAHSEDGQDYPWLKGIHGGLVKIQYEEPPNSGKWQDYTDEIWKIHCQVIDHSPEKLVEAHLKAFVNPNTRFAKLLFHFVDGTVMEPTRKFYELEARWFSKKN